jgi:FlaA1/EpsC-like NDP-sugar epimerase
MMRTIVNSSGMRLLAFLYDLLMAVFALIASLLLRYGSLNDFDNHSLFFGAIAPFCAAAGASLLIMRTYRTSWRHASTADLTNIVYTVTLTVLIYLPIGFVVTRLQSVPRSSVIMAWMMLILLMSGSRIGYRLYREGRLFFSRRPMRAGQVPILIVGGGIDAEILLRSLDRSEYYPVGVLDDTSKGALLRGIPVLGRLGEVEKVVTRFADAGDRPRKLVIVDRTLEPIQIASLFEVATSLGLTVARGPDPALLRPETGKAPQLLPISVEDLLGRAQIVLDAIPVRDLLGGRRVLVTGAGGSIGSEIVRQVCAIGPSAICLVDASEFNLYTIDAEVAERWSAIERSARMIDVRHKANLDACFAAFRPEVVFHAAALKHVPLVEENPLQGIWTNVIGTRNVADAAVAFGSAAMVLISTDKAVYPANVMGASKRCAEAYCQSLASSRACGGAGTSIAVVRFGNVLGSTGSVVPLFERQIRAGGPITVTHPEVERFFMTIREAVQLVLQASALGAARRELAGRVFVLDMGQPIRIVDLARQMIRLAGLQPDRDIAIRFTGLRPGEKLFEEVFHGEEKLEETSVPRLNVGSPRAPALDVLVGILEALERDCREGRGESAMAILRQLVPGFGEGGREGG